MPLRRLFAFFAAAALLSLAGTSGCAGCGAPVDPDEDAGEAGDGADAGRRTDAGVDGGKSDAGEKPDAGPAFKQGFADEPCPDASYDFAPPDGGFPDGTVIRGLCIALTELQGLATIDGAPVQAPIHLTFDGLEYQSELVRPADGTTGAYGVRVMRARYERLLYRPTELLNHAGGKDFGAVDLRKNQTRNLGVQTWIIAGATFFAGQPWPMSVNPPDTTLHAVGLPSQSAWATNDHGGYQVRMMEGEYALRVSVPFAVLGETALIGYPVRPWTSVHEDTTVDLDLPTSELSGNFTVDGQPFPDRLPNRPDYRLTYVKQGESEVSVETVHEAGAPYYSGLVPKGTYSVNLEIEDAADAKLPALLYNKQIAVALDLTQNRALDFNLKTYNVEGAISIDGVTVTPTGGQWILYAFSYELATQPWFLSYYRVPFTSASFDLRALPGEYFLAIYLDQHLHPQFPKGYYEIDSQRPIFADTALPIDIPTQLLEGTLSLDGVPAANAFTDVGTLTFESARGSFQHRVFTEDGQFRVRLPRGKYKIFFEPNPEAYPDYAVGNHPLDVTVDLELESQTLALDYQTVPVGGPLLIAQTQIPDALSPQPEVALKLRSAAGFRPYLKTLQGGQPWYFMRVPRDDYKLTFELMEGVLEGVAFGTAPIGNDLKLDVR